MDVKARNFLFGDHAGELTEELDEINQEDQKRYMPDQEILQSMNIEVLEGLKRQAKQNGDKKIYLIEDMEKSSMFIVYI